MDPSAQPETAKIWMTMVKCAGSEANVLECPFGEASEAQDWKDHNIGNSGCNGARGVGLCCDVSDFCPPRSHWRPDPVQDSHEGQMHGGNMHPQQSEPEMIANCKCDAGFYVSIPVVPSAVSLAVLLLICPGAKGAPVLRDSPVCLHCISAFFSF